MRGWMIGAALGIGLYLVVKGNQDSIMQTVNTLSGDAMGMASDLIKKHEGWSATPYADAVGLQTIGWGHKLLKGEVMPIITDAQGEALLEADITRTANAIRAGYQRTPTPNQEAAFICFAFNVGASAFLGSTMLRKFNAGDIQGAADEFDRWNKARIDGVLTPLPGLTARRADEKAVFLEA